MNFSIKAPAGFDFKRTLNSHGWCELLPFEFVDDSTLVRVLDLPEAAPLTVTVKGNAPATVGVPERVPDEDRLRPVGSVPLETDHE